MAVGGKAQLRMSHPTLLGIAAAFFHRCVKAARKRYPGLGAVWIGTAWPKGGHDISRIFLNSIPHLPDLYSEARDVYWSENIAKASLRRWLPSPKKPKGDFINEQISEHQNIR